MASLRSEYDDKNLKKNAFSGRRLRLELDRLDIQKDHISKQFRHEKDQLRKQIAEGEEILKFKNLDPSEIRPPLSSTDMKKLSPRFAHKLSGAQLSMLPPIGAPAHPPDNSKVGQPLPRSDKRRFSLPAPTIALHECIDTERKRSSDSLTIPKLLKRRASANNALLKDSEDITGRINEFFQKLSKSSENVTIECQKSTGEKSSTGTQNSLPSP
ncbi:Hypothetical predicted protein [Paramuricea clavata]|uniref:Uncharacterized protein n=1 Tax=Paramuricea clavata TaxID=317549 RepID=A0A7D9HAS2_PARCT|nr:Hypothetical predicted protein [Paramuricea clavata]